MFWKNVEIRVNDVLIGTIPERKSLIEGQTFPLPDGTSLKVKLDNISSQLQIYRNDKPLPGTGTDPAVRLSYAYWVIFLLAGINFILGILIALNPAIYHQSVGYGIFSIIISFIYIVLGIFTRRQSIIALVIVLLLYGLDIILSGITNPNILLCVRIGFFIIMAQGISAINEIKKEEGRD